MSEILHSFAYWLAMRIVCALFGHVYWQSETLEDGSAIGFECELCARCGTPNNACTGQLAGAGKADGESTPSANCQ